MVTHCQAVLFDLDGTLVDSVPDIAAAVDQALVTLSLPAVGEAQVRRWVGNGVDVLLERALAHSGVNGDKTSLLASAKSAFNVAYGAQYSRYSRVYPGVKIGLEALRERRLPMACVTNKPSAFAAPVLRELDLLGYFQCVIGGDELPKKPAPDALLGAAARLQVTITRCVLVGDSGTDVAAARAAGCPVICVPYGYNHGQDIRTSQPDSLIESLAELPELLDQHFSAATAGAKPDGLRWRH